MTEKEQLIDYLDLVEREKFKFTRDTGYTPDLLIIHPEGRQGLDRILVLMQQYRLSPLAGVPCSRVISFLGMNVMESEIFTDPHTGLITNQVVAKDHIGDCRVYYVIGKTVAIPGGRP